MQRLPSLLVLFLLVAGSTSAGQVGFRRLTVTDHSRPGVGTTWRSIDVFVWYPARKGGAPMTRADYFTEGGADRASLARTARDELRTRLQRMVDEELSDARLDEVLNETVAPRLEAPPADGKSPIVLVSSGLRSPPHTLSSICERIASAGYIVAAVPTPPCSSTACLGFDQIALETVMRDLESTLGVLAEQEHSDLARVALVGWSVGSVAQALLQMRNPLIDAVVSLDGGIGYDYGSALARESIWFRPEELRVPLLDVRALGTTGVERAFDVLDLPRASTSWRLECNTLSHADLTTTFGELAPKVGSVRVDGVARQAVIESTVLFLDMALKGSHASESAMERLARATVSIRLSKTPPTLAVQDCAAADSRR